MSRALGLDVTAGLTAVAEGGAAFGPSPGYALVDGARVLVGEEALRLSRRHPRLVSSSFWERLDAEPLGPPFPPDLRAADLAHAQLETAWRRVGGGVTEVVIAVPPVWSEGQIGLLLGIAQALRIPVVGLADAALAAAAAGHPGDAQLHVDLDLHGATLTELRRGEALERGRVARADGFGLKPLEDLLVRQLGGAFVRQTRFDPLHDGETEQALFDRLPGWLSQLARQERAVLSFPHSGREVAIELARAETEAWVVPRVEELAQQLGLLRPPGRPLTILLSSRAARLPGLETRLGRLRDATLVTLPAQAAAAGVLRERDAIRSGPGPLHLVTRLPVRPGQAEEGVAGGAVLLPPRPSIAPRPADAKRPTHLLHGAVAHAITAEPLVLGTAPGEGPRAVRLTGESAGISRSHCRVLLSGAEVVVEDTSTWGTFVNGERIASRAVLAAGDRLRLGTPGIELQLIATETGH
jgi:hypothetical protein